MLGVCVARKEKLKFGPVVGGDFNIKLWYCAEQFGWQFRVAHRQWWWQSSSSSSFGNMDVWRFHARGGEWNSCCQMRVCHESSVCHWLFGFGIRPWCCDGWNRLMTKMKRKRKTRSKLDKCWKPQKSGMDLQTRRIVFYELCLQKGSQNVVDLGHWVVEVVVGQDWTTHTKIKPI